MPIYTYKCKSCGEIFEKMKSMNSNGSELCQVCNSEAVRVFSPAGIIFKGSGFYTTDYKSGTTKNNLNISNNSNSGNNLDSKSSKLESNKSNTNVDSVSKKNDTAVKSETSSSTISSSPK